MVAASERPAQLPHLLQVFLGRLLRYFLCLGLQHPRFLYYSQWLRFLCPEECGVCLASREAAEV